MNQQYPHRSVVVTGGNAGLGLECARSILRSGQEWHVVIASRSGRRAKDAVESLTSDTDGTRASTLELDLASLSSVRESAKTLGDRIQTGGIPPLAAVICNAGTQHVSGTTYTEDGFEATFGVNHLGHFLLVNLLLDYIRPPGRIVFVSSGTHDPDQFWNRALNMAPPRLDDVRESAFPEENSNADQSYVGTQRYATSKLANLLTAYELDRRLRTADVSTSAAPLTSNAFDPGLMPGTGLARDYGRLQHFLWNNVLPVLRVLPNVNSPQKSGRDLANLVTDPALETVSGKYFVGREAVNSSGISYDEELAQKLWAESAELVGLNESFLPLPSGARA